MNTNAEKVCRILDDNGIRYRYTEHPPVYTIEEMLAVGMEGSEDVAKNLFLRDSKKNYYLIVIREEKRADLNELRQKLASRRLSFASEEELDRVMGLIRGSVTPLGVLNDHDHLVRVYIDRSFEHRIIGCHPNTNTASVWLETDDLVKLIEKHGNTVQYMDF